MVENISNVKDELFDEKITKVKIDLNGFQNNIKFYLRGRQVYKKITIGVINCKILCILKE